MGFGDEGRAYLSFGDRSPFLAISIAVHMVSAAFFDAAVLYQEAADFPLSILYVEALLVPKLAKAES